MSEDAERRIEYEPQADPGGQWVGRVVADPQDRRWRGPHVEGVIKAMEADVGHVAEQVYRIVEGGGA